MEKFLENIRTDLRRKIVASAKGETLEKTFTESYEEVRGGKKESGTPRVKIEHTCSPEEASIYADVVRRIFKEHPELLEADETK